MAEEKNSFGNISTEEVYSLIGRLYVQLWAATNQANEMSEGLKLAQERNHALEIAMNQKNLQGVLDQGKPAAKTQPPVLKDVKSGEPHQ